MVAWQPRAHVDNEWQYRGAPPTMLPTFTSAVLTFPLDLDTLTPALSLLCLFFPCWEDSPSDLHKCLCSNVTHSAGDHLDHFSSSTFSFSPLALLLFSCIDPYLK